MIKWADRRGLIDRESFLVFYFVLALFCAGTGATLGTDDLLVGFAAGVGFSNDGWFTQKTEESHVSNVIDLLLNLAYFVYLGSIIPWEQYNAPNIGLTPWRLVVIAIFVIFFRRIPIMMALKPLIPDIKTWREALFAGHFGPIGVGAIFASILLRAELEHDSTVPLETLSNDPTSHNYYIVQIVWPLTTFLVITSILVHGSSIAVFTLGKRINTLTITMSYTQANEEGPSWMNRLPRIQSVAKSSMSKGKEDLVSDDSSNEMLADLSPPGTLGPVGVPGNFLRRQKEEDTPLQAPKPTRRKSKWESGMGPGGPIEQSAIAPLRRKGVTSPMDSTSDTLNEKASPTSSNESEEPDQLDMEVAQEKRERKEARQGSKYMEEPEVEAFEEGGDDMVVEDEEGEVLGVHHVRGESDAEKRQHILEDEEALRRETSGEHAKGKFHPHERNEGEELERKISETLGHPEQASRKMWKKLGAWDGWRSKDKDAAGPSEPHEHKRGPAHAYQFGNTIIVEDEDGEVVKKYDLPHQSRRRGLLGGGQDEPGHLDTTAVRQGFRRMGTWAGLGGKSEAVSEGQSEAEASGQVKKVSSRKQKPPAVDPDDDRIRFTLSGAGGRRLSKQDFIEEMQSMDPKARVKAVEDSDAPEDLKREIRADAAEEFNGSRPSANPRTGSKAAPTTLSPLNEQSGDEDMPVVRRLSTNDDRPKGPGNLTLITSNEEVPFHDVSSTVQRHAPASETPAQRRRRLALSRQDSEDDGTERIPPHTNTATHPPPLQRNPISALGERQQQQQDHHRPAEPQGETPAERRRRLAALGEGDEAGESESSDSEDDGGERRPAKGHTPVAEPSTPVERRGIRFVDSPAVSVGRVQWGDDVGRKRR